MDIICDMRFVICFFSPSHRLYEPEAGLSALGGHMKKFLVTGAAGQIGSELTGFLRNIYGNDHVIAAGHVKKPGRELLVI